MTNNSSLFTSDFKAEPYWWNNAPLFSEPSRPIPEKSDILIIGSGYTGLHAGIQTARAGRHTVIIDAEAAGWGCSTRNGGQISTSVKHGYSKLKRRYGEQLAIDILREGQASLDYIQDFIASEKLDCDFGIVGRFHVAHTASQYELLSRECDAATTVLETNAFVVPKDEMRTELGTEAYHGGIVYPRHASVDPAKYHAGIMNVAESAGVEVVSHCSALMINRIRNGWQVETSKGVLHAQKVIIATNGYTGSLTPWQRNRVIPIGSYIIATEALPTDQMDRLFPTNRILSDTRKLVYYYRTSPDRRRILFGGRVSLSETDPRKSGPKIHADLVALFPELQNIRISHSWAGFVGYTFDTLMHAGEHDGLYYAMGYCGSGVGMASYLGMRVGQQAAGLKTGETAFSKIPFKGRPYYNGVPWFLAPSVFAYRIWDKFGLSHRKPSK